MKDENEELVFASSVITHSSSFIPHPSSLWYSHDWFRRVKASSSARSRSAGADTSRQIKHSPERGMRKRCVRKASSKTPGTFSRVNSKLEKPGAYWPPCVKSCSVICACSEAITSIDA